jgi:anti-sigma B factor antagonist
MKIKGTKNKVIVEGNLILDNAEELKKLLQKRVEKITPGQQVILDLSGVQEVDSSGLQLLVAFLKTMHTKGMKCSVNSIQKEMLEILNLSGLAKYFRLEI